MKEPARKSLAARKILLVILFNRTTYEFRNQRVWWNI